MLLPGRLIEPRCNRVGGAPEKENGCSDQKRVAVRVPEENEEGGGESQQW